jgi:hypothetical protein
MNVTKKERVVEEKNRVKKEEHQKGRYSEAGVIYQVVQSHCRLIDSCLPTIGYRSVEPNCMQALIARTTQ